MMTWRLASSLLLMLIVVAVVTAQQIDLNQSNPNDKARAIRTLGDSPDGISSLNDLAPLLGDNSEQVRLEVVTALIKFRAIAAQPLLLEATSDLSSRVQVLAVDGLVDFYSPGFFKQGGFTSTLRDFPGKIKSRFTNPTPLVIPSYVAVNPAVGKAIEVVIRQGKSMEVRAVAARAAGILLLRNALAGLQDGLRSRSTLLISECILAIKKIRDPSSGPSIVFLLRDLDPQVQLAVIETVGTLRTVEATPELLQIIKNTQLNRIKHAALISLAKIPGNGQRDMFLDFLKSRNKNTRAAAAEGLGRIGDPEDLRLLDHQFALDKAAGVKFSLAFALVNMGQHEQLDHLLKGLDSRIHRLEVRAFLVELARKPEILEKLYDLLLRGTAAQRRHLAYVLGMSGTSESIKELEILTRDKNNDVAVAAIDSLRVLQSRL